MLPFQSLAGFTLVFITVSNRDGETLLGFLEVVGLCLYVTTSFLFKLTKSILCCLIGLEFFFGDGEIPLIFLAFLAPGDARFFVSGEETFTETPLVSTFGLGAYSAES